MADIPHRARPSGAPVLIHLHGGGYTQGRKNGQSLPLLYRLASQGWSVSAPTTACGRQPGTPIT